MLSDQVCEHKEADVFGTMSTQTQKALLVTEVGKPLTLATDWPVPQPGPSQLQVRVTVAGLNPHDQKSRDRGLLIANNLPSVLANDVVGKVVEVGSDVTRFKPGDRVASQGTGQGAGLQEIAILDEQFAVKIPDEVSDDEAATLPINVVTAMIALFDDKFGLSIPAPWTSAASNFDYAGTTILIIGGGSNCGRFGVQVAALAEIGRIVVVGGDEAELKSYGATNVIDRCGTPEELLERVQAVVGDDLLYVFDTVNPPAEQIVGINALSSTRSGRLAHLVSGGDIDGLHLLPKKAGHDTIRVFGAMQASPELSKAFLASLPRYLSDGKIKPSKFEIIQGLDANLVNEVLDRYRDGKRVVKPHVHVP